MSSKIFKAVFISAIAYSGISSAASFDCAKATYSTEKMICASPTLSALDDQMAQTYGTALKQTGDAGQLKQDQVVWIKQVRLCLNESCIANLYKQRISELSPAPQSTPAAPEPQTQNNTPAKIEEQQQAQETVKEEVAAEKTDSLENNAVKKNSPLTVKEYIIGILLTLLVTAIPFITTRRRS